MRELERDPPITESATEAPLPALAIVGAGRVGSSLAAAAAQGRDRGQRLAGRDDALAACRASRAALLCVPDEAIADAAAVASEAVPPLELVGHVSGATTLEALAPARAAGAQTFSLHPLQTVPDPAAELTGSPCAISGSTAEALGFARALALRLGMTPFEVAERDRALYHAAACVASNFLVTLEESAAGCSRRAGVPDARELLAPTRPAHGGELVRARPRGPHRPGRARRPGNGRAPSRRAARRTRPSSSSSTRRWSSAPRRSRRRGDEARAHEGGAARRAAPRPARKVARSASCRRWAPCTRATSRCSTAARQRCQTVVMSLFVNPGPVSARRGRRRLSARRGPRPRARGRPRRRPRLRARAGRGLPARVRDHGRGRRRAHPDTRGRSGRARQRALPRRHHRGRQAAQQRRSRRRLLRPEGRPAGARDPAHGPRPRLRGRDRRPADGARGRRPGVELAKRLPRRRAARAGGGAEQRARGGRASRWPAAARPPRRWPPAAPSSTPPGSSPSTSRPATPRAWRRRRASTDARCWSPSRRGSGRRG